MTATLSATSLEVATSLAPMLTRLAPLADSVSIDKWSVTVQGKDDTLDMLIEALGLTYERTHNGNGSRDRFRRFVGHGFAPWQNIEVSAVVVNRDFYVADCDSADHEAML